MSCITNNVIPSVRGYVMKDFDYAVIDTHDEFVLFAGTFAECTQVLDESYGGTAIVDFYDVINWPIENFSVDIPNYRKPFYFYTVED